MTSEALLAELEQLNVKISLAGDKLHVDAPAGVLTPELKQELAKHKPELMALLRPRNEILFPYPLPQTLGLGDVDPRDFRFDVKKQKWVWSPGWWESIPKKGVLEE